MSPIHKELARVDGIGSHWSNRWGISEARFLELRVRREKKKMFWIHVEKAFDRSNFE